MEWEKNHRQLKFGKSFKNNRCVFCSKLIPTKRKQLHHYHRCKIRDLYADPFREQVTTCRTRKWRWECGRCLQRFDSHKKNHKCRENFYNKTLCLYCDRFFIKIWTHKRECKTKDLHETHKEGIITLWKRNHQTFLRRVGKLVAYKNRNIQKRLHREIPTPKKEISKFEREYREAIRERKISSEPWRTLNLSLEKPKMIFVDFFPTKPLIEWTVEERNYWSNEMEIDIPFLHKMVQPTLIERNAAEGLMSIETFLAKQVYRSFHYGMSLLNLKKEKLTREGFKEKEIALFNKEAHQFGIKKGDDGCVSWMIFTDTPAVVDQEQKIIQIHCKDSLFQLYGANFPKVTYQVIENWVMKGFTMGCMMGDKLAGAISYKEMTIANVKFIDVILLAVDFKYRNKGIGRSLLSKTKEIYGKVLLWADEGAKIFYKKNDFRPCKLLWYSLQTMIPFCQNATFSQFGISNEEVQILKKWGDVENAKFK